MMTKRYATLAPLLGALLLSSCAINALRTEYASRVATASEAAALGAERFLSHVEEARQDTNIALAAADPACAKPAPLLRLKPDIGPRAPGSGFLCVDVKQAKPPAGSAISLLPISDDIEPTLKLAQSLAAYGDALATIVEKDPVPPSAPLLEALGLARAAQDALKSLVPRTPTAVPTTDDPRVAAAASLIDFLGELAREADQVKALRTYLATHPDVPKSVLAPLKRQLGSWERARSGDAGILQIVTTAQTQQVLLSEPPRSDNERRAALEQFYRQDRDRRNELKLAPALFELLGAVEDADADLRRVIVENPKLSKAESRRVAALNRARITTALKRIADLANAIRGA